MTAKELSQLEFPELETEFAYTVDQLKRLYGHLEEKSRWKRGFPSTLLVEELEAHKANFNMLCAEMERRYMP
jgi:hypothetical protein